MGLRLTIGERLGKLPRGTTPPTSGCNRTPRVDPEEVTEVTGVPEPIEPEKVVRLADAPSSETLPYVAVGWWCQYCQVQHFGQCDEGPARVRGEMVWLHKTAPTLVIEGREGLSPEDHTAGRRR